MTFSDQLSLGGLAAEHLTATGVQDPSLPALEEFADLATATVWCRRCLPASSGVDAASLVEVLPLRYRPGRRCTLRLEFAAPTRQRLYVKLFRRGRSKAVARRMAALPRPSVHDAVRRPEVIRHDVSDDILVLGEVAGEALSDRLACVQEDVPGARRIADAVAEWHGLVDRIHVDPGGWSRMDEWISVERAWRSTADSGPAGRHLARLDDAPARQHLLDRVREALHTTSFSAPVLLHRDLHPQQILVDDDGVGVVDLDNLALGPPEVDLGNLVAHLDLLELHGLPRADRLQNWSDELMAGYRARRPLDVVAVSTARAATLARLAGVYASAVHLPHLPGRLLERAGGLLSREAAA
ncbi:MAG: phosphotransferase [Acidobacteriota bacterium]